jgi:hypothetical protein
MSLDISNIDNLDNIYIALYADILSHKVTRDGHRPSWGSRRLTRCGLGCLGQRHNTNISSSREPRGPSVECWIAFDVSLFIAFDSDCIHTASKKYFSKAYAHLTT